MVTVSRIVEDIIGRKPFLEEALVNDIINYAYLADMIKPEVEKAMRKEVNRYAIVMAIRRFSETLKESFVRGGNIRLEGADITIASGIFELTVSKDFETVASSSKVYALVDFSKGDFLTITQGLYEITVISNERYMEEIVDLFNKKKVKKVVSGLSSVTVRVPEKAAEEIGLLYMFTKALSWENVNIFEVVSTLSEEIFIIKEEETPVAFNAIKRLISSDRNRK